MQSKAENVQEYMEALPDDRKPAMMELRKILLQNLPKGFAENMSYGMPCYVVPHSIYPDGYHCNPKQALPFISFASQKNFIALYHMGLYADPKLFDWFVKEFQNQTTTKPDMGKSCLRFKKMDQIPFKLIAELVSKITPQEWIKTYETNFKNKPRK